MKSSLDKLSCDKHATIAKLDSVEHAISLLQKTDIHEKEREKTNEQFLML